MKKRVALLLYILCFFVPLVSFAADYDNTNVGVYPGFYIFQPSQLTTGRDGSAFTAIESKCDYVNDICGTHWHLCRVFNGDNVTIELNSNIIICDRVFIGTQEFKDYPNPEACSLTIVNNSNQDYHIWAWIYNNERDEWRNGIHYTSSGSNVLFSVFQNATLKIKGNPNGRIIIHGMGNKTNCFDKLPTGRTTSDGSHPSGGKWQSTQYGFIESTGNLEMEYVDIVDVNFDADNSMGAKDGDCCVIKLNSWTGLGYATSDPSEMLPQGHTILKNVRISNVSNPNGYASVMGSLYDPWANSLNTRDNNYIWMENVKISGVSQSYHATASRGGIPWERDEESAGIIRFRGGWLGDLTMKNCEICDNYSKYSCAGLNWNAVGSGKAGQMPMLTLDGCEFYNNRTDYNAAAMRLSGNFQFTGGVTEVHGNTAGGSGGGIEICPYTGYSDIEYNTITQDLNECLHVHGNTAGNKGGGIFINFERTNHGLTNGMDYDIHINGCDVNGNTAVFQGGGIDLSRSPSHNIIPDITLDGGTISHNTVTGTTTNSGGGGMHVWNANIYSNDKTSAIEINYNKAQGTGGGLCIEGTCNVDLDMVTLSYNSVSGDGSSEKGLGGGAYLSNGVKVQIDEMRVLGNTADVNGGGIYVITSAGSDLATVEIGNATIQGNRANGTGAAKSDSEAPGEGGGIYVQDSKMTINGGSIYGNSATTSGGGVLFRNTDRSTIDNRTFALNGGTISRNTSGRLGGGMAIFTAGGGTINYAGGSVSNNTSGFGGGIYIDGSTVLNIANADIESNTANLGGGVFLHAGATMTYNKGHVRNNYARKLDGSAAPKTGYCQYQFDMSGKMGENEALEGYGLGGGIYVGYRAHLDLSGADLNNFGIYGNLADWGGDDIHTVGGDHQNPPVENTIYLPNVNNMELSGYSVPVEKNSLYWMEDYIAGDQNYASAGLNGLNGAVTNDRYRKFLSDFSPYLANIRVTTTGWQTKKYLSLALGYTRIKIKITKEGMKEGESAIFNIKNGDTQYMQVQLTCDSNGKAERWVVLTPGTWTIEETSWSWAYTPGTASITKQLSDNSSESDRTFAFTNTAKPGTVSHAEGVKVNEITPAE